MDIVNSNIKKKKTLIKTIDILGREVNKVKHKIFIEIYEDGSSKKHVIFE